MVFIELWWERLSFSQVAIGPQGTSHVAREVRPPFKLQGAPRDLSGVMAG